MMKRLVVGWGILAACIGCRQDKEAEGATTAGVCPPEWLQAPGVEPAIAVPDGGSAALVRVAAAGTQNYACSRAAGDAGATFAWTLVGPEAALSDCHGVVVGQHFPSDAGASGPEWQLRDGSYVVGHKVAASPAGPGSVPWLLLSADGHGGGGLLAGARFVQRVATHGGAAPSAGCDEGRAGALQKVPYTADYYFFGP
jgi:hypothetical protein